MAKTVNVHPEYAGNVSYLTALAGVRLLRECSALDLTVDDYEFLTQNKLWLPLDRSRARRCVEAAIYGGLDVVGFPRFPPPVEFVAAAIAYFVHPQNIMSACVILDGVQWSENIIAGVEEPVSPHELFAHVLRILADQTILVEIRESQARLSAEMAGNG